MKGNDKIDQSFPREYNSHFSQRLVYHHAKRLSTKNLVSQKKLQKKHSKTHTDNASHQKIQYFII